MSALSRDPAAALVDEDLELAVLLDRLTADEWALPSACAGWDLKDVVLHLAQTNELAVASLEGRFADEVVALASGIEPAGGVDDWAALVVEKQSGADAAAVHERWHDSTQALDEVIGNTDMSTKVQWIAGELAARTLVTTRLAETWIHAGDIAAGLGVELEPTDRLWHIARLAWRTLPHAFARAGKSPVGLVSFELVGPSGDAWRFAEDGTTAATTVSGAAVDLCRVASRRVDPAGTTLVATGVDGADVLRLVRTWA